jgi:trans-L-3-hydroxyproline dehydratase
MREKSDTARALAHEAPRDWTRIETIDAHAAGEPFRVILRGLPTIPGKTMLERRRFVAERLDGLRRALMWEPRGHADMYGGIVTPPATEDGDLGVLFVHNAGLSTMCGHGTIALATVALETGLVARDEGPCEIRIDAPAGRVTARAELRGGRVREVAFENVPSFVVALDLPVRVGGANSSIRVDVAYGGAFYAVCGAADFGLEIRPDRAAALIDAAMRVKRAVAALLPVRHPESDDLGFLYGTILTGAPVEPGAHSRNVCVFADGEVDRSPTGTGVSARLAIERLRGTVRDGEPFVVESLIGTRFTGRTLRETAVGPHEAIVPEVTGSAYLTGRHTFFIAPDDPLREGFFVR